MMMLSPSLRIRKESSRRFDTISNIVRMTALIGWPKPVLVYTGWSMTQNKHNPFRLSTMFGRDSRTSTQEQPLSVSLSACVASMFHPKISSLSPHQ